MSHELIKIHRSVQLYYARGVVTQDLIFDNLEKSVTIPRAGTGAQPTKTLYNSAILFVSNEAGFISCFAFVMGDNSFTINYQASNTDSGWTTYGTANYTNNVNNCYTSTNYTEVTISGKTFVHNWNQSIGDPGTTYEVLAHYIPVFTDIDEYMTYITTPYVAYNWSSVPTISGKMGILRLPTLFNDTDGNPVSGAAASDFLDITPQSNFRDLYPNVVFNEEKIVIYSGDEFVATFNWASATSVTVKWYHGHDLIYTCVYTLAHATDELYFAMLIDINDGPDVPPEEVHRWGRPSIVIKDGTTGLYSYNTESVPEAYYNAFYEWIVATYTSGYDIWGDPNMEAGGDGYGDLDDDPISDPGAPTIGAVGTGMTKLYWISGEHKDKISDLMDWFNDPDLQFINKIFTGDPIEALIGINLSPLALTAVGTPNMHFLGIDTEIASDGAIADQYQEIDCGTIKIKKWMKNTYLDFAPFTKIKAVLPYVGIIDLDVDDIKGKTLHLKYTIDALTGSCVAHIFVNNSLHYEASGNCFINIPISNKDYSQLIAAEKGAIASVAQTLMSTGGLMAMGTGATPAGAIAMVGGAMVSNAINVAASHPSVRYVGGNTGATTGYMGFDRPFLIVEQPILARPENDQHYFGMPSYITDKIGTFSKFNKFSNMHLESIPCTESERADIETALKNGVIIQIGSSAPDVTPSVTGDYVIVLLHNLSETNTIGKKWKTGTGEFLKIEGKLLYDQSILTPSFLISGAASVYTYNYAYVPALHRYYYINDIIARTNDCLQLDMISDPLQSFQAEIKECKGICARAEERTNFLINDGAITVQQKVDVKTIQFRKNNARFSFTRASAGFVIIVASGG